MADAVEAVEEVPVLNAIKKPRDVDVAEEEAIKARASPDKSSFTSSPDGGAVDGLLQSFRQFSQTVFGSPTSGAPPATIKEEDEVAAGVDAPAPAMPAPAPAPAAPNGAGPAAAEEAGEEHDAVGELPPSAVGGDSPSKIAGRRPSAAVVVATAVVKAPAKGMRKLSKMIADVADAALEELDDLTKPSSTKPAKKK